MNCPRCTTANPEGADFCMKCAAPLTPAAAARMGLDPLDLAQTDLGLPAGLVLIDRFRIERQIGWGGMGRVYLAHDAVLGEPVAVKVMREILSRDTGAVKRLAAEARASMKLSHPNIVRVHDYHAAPMTKFLAMEFVEGETLKDRLDREGKLGEGEARRLAVEICKGLEHAHQKKVIHRDLKPGNILLGKDGCVKIADFGIARVCRDSMTRLTSVQDSGTLPYMSPEQMMGESTELSDIYSLGIILYEMLSGDPPFHTGEIAEQIRSRLPKPLEGVSAEMNALVLRCLEKDPAKRFRSAAELREELDGTARRRDEARARAEEARRREEERKREEERRRREEERRLQEERERRQREEARRKEEEESRRAEEERRRNEEQLRRKREDEERRKQASLLAAQAARKRKRIVAAAALAALAGAFAIYFEIRSSVGMEFVAIPPGRFRMGCSAGDDECDSDEKPAHEVEITRGFELGKYEVTQEEWQKLMGRNPSYFKGDPRLPVEQVSWKDAQEFIARLNGLNDGYVYRLPTEAEWEYAARAGTTGKCYGDLEAIAWYDNNSGGKTRPVGQKQPNGFGLYDMLGNVWEWCSDWYDGDYYKKSPTRDPEGPSSGGSKVLRGASWFNVARYARASTRDRVDPDYRSLNFGLRVARVKK